ncbi:MAG: acyl carrier protein [Lachnospiraceae bacterium]|nr:acyl carrier protein [Lachnospiraceae bacterium]
MKNMTTEEKVGLIEELMDLDEGTLSLEDRLEDYEEWDSLSKLSLIAETKKKFNKVLSTDELRNFISVKDICDFLG